jgi:hypothetical protein
MLMGDTPMRRMILRMIATGSLSAFSSAVLPGLPSQGVPGMGAPGTVQQARVGQREPPSPQPGAPAAAEPGKTALPPSRTLPRGSLLDLSV